MSRARDNASGTLWLPGEVVQRITATSGFTNQSITSSTPVALSGMSATIVPRFANSKIIVEASVNASWTYVCSIHIFRNGTNVSPNHGGNNQTGGSNALWTKYLTLPTDTTPASVFTMPVLYAESPNTTASLTYDLRANAGWAGGTNTFFFNNRSDQDMLGSSWMTVTEIRQ